MSDVAARLFGLIDRVSGSFPGGGVCLVSHADVIKAAICRCLGKSFQAVHDFEIAPASITTILVDGGRGRVLSLDETSFHEPEEAVR